LKILVLGGYGAQGSVMCMELVKHPKVSEVICAGRRLEQAEAFKDKLKSEKLSTRKVDLSRVDELRKAAKDVDVVINAASYIYDLRAMKAAIENGASYQDLALGPCIDAPGALVDKVLDLKLELDKKFKNIRKVALIATGMDPGITDIIAAYASDKLDHVYEIRMKDCGVTKSKKPISTWAPQLLWADMIEKPYVYEDGKLKRVPPFSGEEIYVFPDPIGPQPCYHHFHEEPVIMPRFIEGLRYVEFKMCGPSMPLAKAVYDYGLARKEPVTVKGVKVAPLDLFLALTPPPPTMEEVEKMIKNRTLIDDIACLVMDIKGEEKGKEVNYSLYTLLTLQEANRRMRGTTATSYFVGIGGEVFTELLIEGEIKTKGVAPPEALAPKEKVAVIKRLSDKGIKIYEISRRPLP